MINIDEIRSVDAQVKLSNLVVEKDYALGCSDRPLNGISILIYCYEEVLQKSFGFLCKVNAAFDELKFQQWRSLELILVLLNGITKEKSLSVCKFYKSK